MPIEPYLAKHTESEQPTANDNPEKIKAAKRSGVLLCSLIIVVVVIIAFFLAPRSGAAFVPVGLIISRSGLAISDLRSDCRIINNFGKLAEGKDNGCSKVENVFIDARGKADVFGQKY